MKKLLIMLTMITIMLFSNITFAGNEIALNYNIVSDVKNCYVIDSVHTNKIGFSLFENEDLIYCNGTPVTIENNRFEISIEGLVGKQEFIITNSLGEVVNYTFYISDKDGYLENFILEEVNNPNTIKTYIKTINGISIIYTNKEKHIISELEKIILSLPENILVNLKELKLIPSNHESGAAGVTKYNNVTLYNISKYSRATIKNIVIHEIAHTWAHSLRENKVIDYSYTNYQKAVKLDKNFPSNYAERNVKNGNYNEDFAESIAFFLINRNSFEKNYPSRTDYIKEIIDK